MIGSHRYMAAWRIGTCNHAHASIKAAVSCGRRYPEPVIVAMTIRKLTAAESIQLESLNRPPAARTPPKRE